MANVLQQRLGRAWRCPSAQGAHKPAVAPVASAARHRVIANVAAVETVQGEGNPTSGQGSSNSERPSAPRALLTPQQQLSLARRHRSVARHFNTAMGVDDFLARLEVALNGFGFTGENAIAMTNLCRDEVTTVLKDKIEAVFGSSFNTNGLGAVLTCGLTGMGAGFSHSPISNGKEHYVFFAFPHIAINSAGEVGAITRPGRPAKSCACGALQKCLIELKAEGYKKHCKVPGVHDAFDPEYSILKQRLARRVRYEGLDPTKMDLVDMTHVAERTITNDMEFLIEKAVDTSKANYAVVTGVQIHNWATELTDESEVPSLEFVAPAKVFVVMDGVKYHIDISRVPTMSPRQLQLMSSASTLGEPRDLEIIIGTTAAGTLKEIPIKYLTQRLGVTKDQIDDDIIPDDELGEEGYVDPVTRWQNSIIADMAGYDRDSRAPNMDSMEEEDNFTSFRVLGGLGAVLTGNSGKAGVPWPPGI